jgi:hypothetical protein
MSQMGQTRLGRADGRSGHVGYPPTATGSSGALERREVPLPAVNALLSCRRIKWYRI